MKRSWLLAAMVWIGGPAWGASLTLDWDAVTTNADTPPTTITDLAGYQVFYATYSFLSMSTATALNTASVIKPVFAGNVLTQTISGLSDGASYYFRLTARDNLGNHSGFNVDGGGADVEVSTFTPLPPPPAAPVLSAPAAVTAARIDVSWSNVAGETSFRLERSLDDFATTPQVATVTAANATSFSDTGRSPSTQYWYRVFAVNAGGDSPASNIGSATTPALPSSPNAPTDGGASGASDSRITVFWTDNANNEESFEVVWSLSAGFTVASTFTTTSLIPSTTGNMSRTIGGLNAGTTYYFRVRAVNAGGASAFTAAVAWMTFPAAPATPTFPAVSSTSVTLTWTNVAGETGYRIERRTGSSSAYTVVGTVGPDVTTFVDNTGLQPDTRYYYRVYSYNRSGNTPTADGVVRTSAGVGLNGFTPPPGLREAYCYPSPVKGVDPVIRAVMGGVESIEVTIFDQSGRAVHSGRSTYSTTVGGETAFDYTWTGEKAPGVYYAVIHGKKGDETIRARAKFAVVR